MTTDPHKRGPKGLKRARLEDLARKMRAKYLAGPHNADRRWAIMRRTGVDPLRHVHSDDERNS